jgi:ribonuclease T2
MKIQLGVALALAAAIGSPAAAAGHDVGKKPPGQFDYYVLSLSWVPGFCATNHSSPGECHKNLVFALHGLWPQLNGGNWPSNCSTVALSASDKAAGQGVFADDSMIPHEWAKHGTCSGLQPPAYFALATSTRQGVKMPAAYTSKTVLKSKDAPAVIKAFGAANTGLTPAGMTTVSTKGVITEVDVCVTKTGALRAC